MRRIVSCLLLLQSFAFAQKGKADVLPPSEFTIGRHYFFDFGPPSDYYELLLVRSVTNGSSIERIIVTPATSCYQPAKVETKSVSTSISASELLGGLNPCAISGKELKRETKRCKKCLVFSGVDVRMKVQCGTQTRIIRSDILDRDLYDPNPQTPPHTSWTMQLLERIDHALGPGVMDKPMFTVEEEQRQTAGRPENLQPLQEIEAGKYDGLFQGAPDKLSDLYVASRKMPPVPIVRLASSSPIEPDSPKLPGYPPLAKLARIEGVVEFELTVGSDGSVTNFTLVSGHPMLRVATENAVASWRFSNEAVGQRIRAAIEFATNCPSK